MFARVPSIFGRRWPGDGIEGIAIAIISSGGVNLKAQTLGTVITRRWALAGDLGGITTVFHLDLAIVADETRETIAVVARVVIFQIEVGVLVVDGRRALEAGRAAVAVERRNLRADYVGTVVDQIFDDTRLLGGDDERVTSIAHGGCPRKEEEEGGGEGLVEATGIHFVFRRLRMVPNFFCHSLAKADACS